MNRCPPGTKRRNALRANSTKNCLNLLRSSSDRMVKRGTGLRVHPSKEGGRRQTPPLPLRNLAFSVDVYSFSPYGGSVTIAWMEFEGCESIQLRQSAK